MSTKELIVILEKTLENPLDSSEIKPVNPKGNQPWILIGRTEAEAEAEALILWSSEAKSPVVGKDPDAGKDWRQKKKGVTEDEMVIQQHQVNGHESKQTPGDSGGQRILTGYTPWGHRVGHDLGTICRYAQLNYFAVYLKLRQHYKSAIFQ